MLMMWLVVSDDDWKSIIYIPMRIGLQTERPIDNVMFWWAMRIRIEDEKSL